MRAAPRRVAGSRSHVGDVLCPGVDTDAWARENTVQLFPGKRNIWLLARSNDESLSEGKLVSSLHDAFGYWFDSMASAIPALEGRYKYGDADDVRVLKISPEMITTRPEGFEVSERRENLKTIPTARAGVPVYVLVQFDYRGKATSMPWPIYASRWYASGRCPNDTDWMLLYNFKPKQPVPPERSDTEVLTDFSNKAAEEVSSTVGRPFYFAGAVLGVLAIAYIIGKVK